MSLSEFHAALLDPECPAPTDLTDPGGRPAGRRFDVYRNNVAVSLTEALRQAFPVIRKLVGDDFFTAMAREHARRFPPRSPLLMFYGEDMPDFLNAFPPVAHLGYLPDVARLELALRQSYHAADAEPLPAVALQGLSTEAFLSARLRLAPSLRLLRSTWPVLTIWRANTAGTAPPLHRVAEDVLILRPGFDPEPQLLPPGGASFVAALLQGEPVTAALDAAPDLDLAATLGLLLAGGAIAGFDQKD